MRANESRPAGNGAAIKKLFRMCGLNSVQLTTAATSSRVLRGTSVVISERGC